MLASDTWSSTGLDNSRLLIVEKARGETQIAIEQRHDIVCTIGAKINITQD